jgi:sporulation protein YlmC with PRC-barrel domain
VKVTYQDTGRTATRARTEGWNLIRADELTGRDIVDANNESLGQIGDLYLDYDEHTVRYVTVDVGGFLGMGAKTVLVPFERLQWSADGDQLFLPVERRVLEEAPEFDPQSGSYDQGYEERIAGVWETEQYWNTDTYGTRHERRR